MEFHASPISVFSLSSKIPLDCFWWTLRLGCTCTRLCCSINSFVPCQAVYYVIGPQVLRPTCLSHIVAHLSYSQLLAKKNLEMYYSFSHHEGTHLGKDNVYSEDLKSFCNLSYLCNFSSFFKRELKLLRFYIFVFSY